MNEYLQKAMALYGLEIAETLKPNSDQPDYEEVQPDYYRTLTTDVEKETWLEYVVRHKEKLPQEWANQVVKNASNDDLLPIA